MAIEAISPRRIMTRNPADGSVVADFAIASPGEVQQAVARARAAQPAWAELSARQRLRSLRLFQRLLSDRKRQVAELISRETGKPVGEAIASEIVVVLDTVSYLASTLRGFLRPEPVPHANLAVRMKRGMLLREPYGVVGIISPWNYPLGIPASEVLCALACGNAVVLKPSEFTTLTALELGKLLAEALRASGAPADVMQVVAGDGSTGAALLESGIDKLVFTGSVATGKRVAQAAAARLLPVLLELGGKDPMLVLEDADVDVASSAAVWGGFMNAGQTCLSVERCYVHRSLHDKFVELCRAKTEQLKLGPGADPATDVGPLIHQQQLRTVESHVEDALARGAKLVIGGKRRPELGENFYAPTILTRVTHDMRIMREETFGPVLPIAAFDSEPDAIRLANDSEFGLAASVWTRDSARGERVARRLEAGAVMVNDVVSCFGISEAPHGGVKSSGLGRTRGRFGLEEMVRPKYVDVDLLPGMKKAWWFGYGRDFPGQMESFSDFLFAGGLRRLRGGIRTIGTLWRPRR